MGIRRGLCSSETRVSTADQKLDLQNDALTKAGCERIFTDTAGGAGAERVGLEQALGFACTVPGTRVVGQA